MESLPGKESIEPPDIEISSRSKLFVDSLVVKESVRFKSLVTEPLKTLFSSESNALAGNHLDK